MGAAAERAGELLEGAVSGEQREVAVSDAGEGEYAAVPAEEPVRVLQLPDVPGDVAPDEAAVHTAGG